ncbi:hypothetical protein NE237_012035 [Protea cynaroides]|uniref:Uncharacterized protein n=1 Tax=Protea cynaroides TaxID=273540 RepID=A0A9Q0GW49_9MAGN|nr:hypothetical protein NE237_012035 [Protea cynaroides]
MNFYASHSTTVYENQEVEGNLTLILANKKRSSSLKEVDHADEYELCLATDNFNSNQELGDGGLNIVYERVIWTQINCNSIIQPLNQRINQRRTIVIGVIDGGHEDVFDVMSLCH